MEEHHKKSKAMQDVSPEIAQGYSDYLFKKKRLTAGRHNKLVTTCNVMYRLAGIPSPFANVTKYQVPEAEHREPFEVQQVEQLLSVATGEMRGLVAVLYFTGLRAGDAVQLKHENRRDGKIVLKTSKNKWSAASSVDILEHPMLTTILEETCGNQSRGPLFPELSAIYLKDNTALIKRFNQLMSLAFGDEFSRTEKRKGRGVLSIARFGMHSFRHSLASHCARAGVPIGIVQKWLGHASATITRIYQHYSTEDQKQVVSAIPMLALPGHEPTIIDAEITEQKPVDHKVVYKLIKSLNKKNMTTVRAKLLALLGEKQNQTDKGKR
jgi:integrase